MALSMLTGWAGLSCLLVTIWALTGADYFWPVRPMLGTGITTFPPALAVALGVGGDQGRT